MGQTFPFFFFFLLISQVLTDSDPDITQTEANTVSDTTKEDPLKQVITEECRSTAYSSRCLKLGVLRLIGRAGGGSLALSGGLSLRAHTPPPPPPHLLRDPKAIDNILLASLAQYLGSLSLNVKIMDSDAPMKLARAYTESSFTGRGKGGGKYGGALAAMGLMSGGTMLAVGMAALAAMAGKALMAAMLALMLAAIAALKSGGDDKMTTYEVVAKPIVSHHHSHSSEVHHGHGHKKRSLDTAHFLAYSQQIPK